MWSKEWLSSYIWTSLCVLTYSNFHHVQLRRLIPDFAFGKRFSFLPHPVAHSGIFQPRWSGQKIDHGHFSFWLEPVHGRVIFA